ncbi:hypothetical protein Aperf_G00000088556 [Anoplocephala perfoliata]
MDVVALTGTRKESYSEELTNYHFLNSGDHVNERPNSGVAFLVQAGPKEDFRLVSNIVATLTLHIGKVKVGLLQCHAPAECSTGIGAKESSYTLATSTYKTLSAHCHEVIVLGDFNCPLGTDARNLSGNLVGPFADQKGTTENGLRFLSLCQEFGLYVVNSFFQKPDRRPFPWYYPTGKGAVIDFVLMKRSRRLLIMDLGASRKADTASDHCLLTAIVKSKECDGGHHLGRRGRW